MIDKPHTNQHLSELKVSPSYFHLALFPLPSPIASTPQDQSYELKRDNQCSSKIHCWKTDELFNTVHYLYSMLSHFPHPPPNLPSLTDSSNNQAIS